VALIATVVTVAGVLLLAAILALLFIFRRRRRQRAKEDSVEFYDYPPTPFTPTPPRSRAFHLPQFTGFNLPFGWRWNDPSSVTELPSRGDDKRVLLEKPPLAYSDRKYPGEDPSSRLDRRVTNFFTPEIRDMLQQVPNGRGNQVSVRVSMGHNRKDRQSSSSGSWRSLRWSRLRGGN